jgi:hypothetical protein
MEEKKGLKALKNLRVLMGWMLAALFLAFFWVDATACASEPLLTTQPVYGGMRFYVYQPQGIPKNWYTTYDSYPVWKNGDGVWYYGIYNGTSLVPTDYAVGSVVPSSVGITPYVSGRGVYRVPLQEAPPAATPAYGVYPAAPEWMLNPQFQILGTWRKNVDRVGILRKPFMPVAWKGDSPQVIYAWTGTAWHQMVPRDGQRPGDVLRNQLYSLTRLVNRQGGYWSEPEVAFLAQQPEMAFLAQQAAVAFLAQQAVVWGFSWIGEFNVVPEEY